MALHAEAAAAQGGHTATIMVDIVKAYEMARLDLVWWAATRLRMPAWMARPVLGAAAMPRRVALQQALGPPAGTLSALVAGSSFATDFLLALLRQPYDQIRLSYPGTRLSV